MEANLPEARVSGNGCDGAHVLIGIPLRPDIPHQFTAVASCDRPPRPGE